MSAIDDDFLASLESAGPPPADPALPYLEIDAKGKVHFHIDRLGAKLAAETPFANGGNLMYVYRDGAYRPNGRRDVLARIRTDLGPHWLKQRALDTLTWLEHDLPQLDDSPPLNRINVRNGILQKFRNNTTGNIVWKLEKHDPALLSPVQIGAIYDPDAECPEIDKFISTVLPGHEQIVHELAGYLITPDNRYQKAVMCLDSGGGGKSKFIGMLDALIGKENVSHVALHQLEEDRFATADLYGRLLNSFADLDSRALKASSIFKSIVGGDPIRAERKNRDAFSYTPYARLIFSANEAPPTSDNSSAFFDRWLVLPFHKRFRGADSAERDDTILDKITTPDELSGLLNHALAGLSRLHEQRRFSTTDDMNQALERFKTDSDSVAGFIEESCTIDADAKVGQPEFNRAYSQWCQEANRSPLGSRRVAHRLRDDDRIGEVKSRGTMCWTGLRLNDPHTR